MKKSRRVSGSLQALFGEFPDEIGLLRGELFGDVDKDADVLVALAFPLEVGNAEPLHPDLGVALGARRDLQALG